MRYIDNTLYIEFQELVDAGIQQETLKKAKLRNSTSFTFRSAPEDERKVLIEYETMRDRYKALVRKNLCAGRSPHQHMAGKILDKHLISKQTDIDHFKEDPLLSHWTIENAIEACKYLYLLERHSRALEKKKSFPHWTIDEFWENIAAHIKTNPAFSIRTKHGIRIPASKAKLNHLAKRYHAHGPGVVISGRLQNRNAMKMGKRLANEGSGKKYTEYDARVHEKQLALLKFLRSHPHKLRFTEITEKYNMVAAVNNWPAITTSQTLNLLEDYRIEAMIKPFREGSNAFYNEFALQEKRRRPSRPLYYVTVDGWDVELAYQRHDGKRLRMENRLVVVVVLDPYNDYPVGYAIDDSESPALLRMAMKNAFDHVHEMTGEYIAPYQVQSDHYAIKQMTPFYQAVARMFTPARVRNAKSKVVERYFLHLNNKYCKFLPNWTGYGITSRKEIQPSTESKKSIKKHYPDRDSCIRQIEGIFEKERENKREQWIKGLDNAEKKVLTREMYLRTLGWETKRTIRANGSGVTPRIGGVKFFYDTREMEFRRHFHRDWKIRYDEKDMSTVMAETEDGKYKFMLYQKHEQPMAIKDQTEEDRKQLQLNRAFNKHMAQEILNDHNNVKLKMAEMAHDSPAIAELMQKLSITYDGQMKDPLQEAKGKRAALKARQEAMDKHYDDLEKSWEKRQEDFINSKGTDFSKYDDV